MIAFDLICSNGHVFECWFKDSASFEEQKSAGIINCPVCDDVQVEKVFSPFVIKKGGDKKKEEMNPQLALRLINEYLDKHFEDVGSDFAKEALKIHWEEAEKRNIKGIATPQEETLLKEEGVQFIKVPIIKHLYN
jgi:hypothetical protein